VLFLVLEALFPLEVLEVLVYCQATLRPLLVPLQT